MASALTEHTVLEKGESRFNLYAVYPRRHPERKGRPLTNNIEDAALRTEWFRLKKGLDFIHSQQRLQQASWGLALGGALDA